MFMPAIIIRGISVGFNCFGRCLDRSRIQQVRQQEDAGADRPFHIDDMRQQPDGRNRLPADQRDQAGQDGIECGIFAAEAGREQREQNHHTEGGGQAESHHQRLDDPADCHRQH